MSAKTTIRKILFVAVWLCIGGGMFTLLMAAIGKKNRGECSGYIITINDEANNSFLSKNEIEMLVKKSTGTKIKGELINTFSLHTVEDMLEKNPWINDAELYFDNQDRLHIAIDERSPVARVFTTEGASFYIDKNGVKIPLSDKKSARVPVFTGFTASKKLNSTDSALLEKVTSGANYILGHPFWFAQVSQIAIAADGTMELIPVVGNHIVRLGEGDNIERKLNRLMAFYTQVLNKTGFDKYKIIDVQFEGQVVASKSTGNAKVDSIQLRKNVEKLLQQSREAENDTVVKVTPLVNKQLENDAVNDTPLDERSNTDLSPNEHNNPNPTKSALSSKEDQNKNANPVVKKVDKPKDNGAAKTKADVKKPKAVMPPKNEDDKNGGYN